MGSPLPEAVLPRGLVTLVFFVYALSPGLLSGAMPVLMHASGLDAARLGLGLTMNTGAYTLGMVLTGRLARHFSLRRLIVAALLCQSTAATLLFNATAPWAMFAGLALLGFMSGALDLVMNAEGTAVERALGRPVFTRMHAAASLGFALSALAGSVLSTGLGAAACAVPVLLLAWPLAWRVARQRGGAVATDPVAAYATSTGDTEGAVPPAATPRLSPAALRRAMLVPGLLLGVAIAAEVTAQMWSARFLVGQAPALAALAGAGAAFLAGCQALVRLGGDTLRRRFGDRRLMLAGFSGVTLGFTAVAVSGGFATSLVAFALVGLCAACIVPCCFALIAQRCPDQSASALGTASGISALIRLPAPALLGLVAAAASDAAVFGCLAAALALAALLAWRGIDRR